MLYTVWCTALPTVKKVYEWLIWMPGLLSMHSKSTYRYFTSIPTASSKHCYGIVKNFSWCSWCGTAWHDGPSQWFTMGHGSSLQFMVVHNGSLWSSYVSRFCPIRTIIGKTHVNQMRHDVPWCYDAWDWWHQSELDGARRTRFKFVRWAGQRYVFSQSLCQRCENLLCFRRCPIHRTQLLLNHMSWNKVHM